MACPSQSKACQGESTPLPRDFLQKVDRPGRAAPRPIRHGAPPHHWPKRASHVRPRGYSTSARNSMLTNVHFNGLVGGEIYRKPSMFAWNMGCSCELSLQQIRWWSTCASFLVALKTPKLLLFWGPHRQGVWSGHLSSIGTRWFLDQIQMALSSAKKVVGRSPLWPKLQILTSYGSSSHRLCGADAQARLVWFFTIKFWKYIYDKDSQTVSWSVSNGFLARVVVSFNPRHVSAYAGPHREPFGANGKPTCTWGCFCFCHISFNLCSKTKWDAILS